MVTKNLQNYDVTGTNEGVLYGLSTDTKPTDETIRNGYRFYEMDTQTLYLYDEEHLTWLVWYGNGGGGGGSAVVGTAIVGTTQI